MKQPKARELKCQARILLDGHYKTAALATLLMVLANVGLNYLLAYAFPSTNGLFGELLLLIAMVICNSIYYILLAGLMRLYLNLCRGRQFRLGDIFYFFSDRPEQMALYSLVQFILQNVSSYVFERCVLVIRSRAETSRMLLVLAIAILVVLVTAWLQLCLGQVLFLYCDAPWKTAPRLIRESWQLMRGNKGRLLYLVLSFAGVSLLGILSLGIGFLFIRPYFYVSRAVFYLGLVPAAEAGGTEENFASDN